jgi:hypothetical protein
MQSGIPTFRRNNFIGGIERTRHAAATNAVAA